MVQIIPAVSHGPAASRFPPPLIGAVGNFGKGCGVPVFPGFGNFGKFRERKRPVFGEKWDGRPKFDDFFPENLISGKPFTLVIFKPEKTATHEQKNMHGARKKVLQRAHFWIRQKNVRRSLARAIMR